MDQKTENILKHDTVKETEKRLGKRWTEFNPAEEVVCLSNAVNDNKEKSDHLKSIKDTYHSMSWNEFKTMVENYGFKIGLAYDVKSNHSDDIEEFILYYHVMKGLIMWVSSYFSKTKINSGTCYGEIKPFEGDENIDTVWSWISSGGIINNTNIFKTDFDIREGMFFRLNKLESHGNFMPIWTGKDRFLWFLDWNEQETKDYDYKKITSEKISKCPDEVINIIGN